MFIYKFISRLIQNKKYNKLLNEAYERENLIAAMSSILGTQLKRDWIGRLYCVVNPAIRDGKFDQAQAFEYTESGIDTTEHAKEWIISKLALLQDFITTNNLFDVLGYNIKQLDKNGNYLFVLYPITLPATMKAAKWALGEISIVAISLTTYFTIF